VSLVADDVDVGSELSLGHETVLSQLKHGLGDLKAGAGAGQQDNGDYHVTAFRPISEAALSWSHDKSKSTPICTQRFNVRGQLQSQLKHGLGDLKAEWLLMRRDIQQVRHQAASLRALGMRSKVGSG